LASGWTAREDHVDAQHPAGTVDTLAAHRQAESELSYMAYFRGIIPEFCNNYDDDVLRALIRDGIASAREYDVREDPALKLYLTLCIVIAPDFHKLAQFGGRVIR
jgi:hypothetical protein